jgi:hypothetical protein
MKKQILIGLIIITLISCTKTIDFDDEGLANRVIVNCIVSPEGKFMANLTKSTSILEDRQNNPPTNGSLDLFEDGILIKSFPDQTGGFSMEGNMLHAGKTYKMVITSNGKKLEAETNIPNQVDVISVDTATVSVMNNTKDLDFKIKIRDPEGKDYYRIVYINESIRYENDNTGTRKYYRSRTQFDIASDDPVFKSVYSNFGDEIMNSGPGNDSFIFPDDYFQGKEYTIKFRTAKGGYGNHFYPINDGYAGYGGNGQTKKIFERNEIHIQKLSKDLYNYMKYLKLYNHYHDNPFSEPVPVYSNVKNGIGIFAGFNDETKLQYDKSFIPFSMDTIKLEEGWYGY